MTQLSIIIPVHEFNDTVKEYLTKAIQSVNDQKSTNDAPVLALVFPPKAAQVIFFIKELNIKNVVKLITTSDDAADYQSQINWAVKEIDTDYFSVLEFDDELGITYTKNAKKYIEAYPSVDLFLPMMLEVNTENNPLKISNEIGWSQHFAGDIENLGFLNIDTVKSYSDFKLSGAIFKKSDFLKNGEYKVNIKLTFMFEYLLRILNNNSKAFIIPKIVYKHLVDRPDSMFEIYSKTMPKLERKFWFDVAMKEYFFSKDREINLLSIS